MYDITQKWEGVDLHLEGGNPKNKKSNATVKYLVRGAVDDLEAINAAFEFAPADFQGIPRQGAELTERLTETTWLIEISYAHDSDSDPEDDTSEESTLSFDCSGGTRHVTTAIAQECLWHKSGAKFRNAGKYINWNGKTGDDMAVNGVDIPTAQTRETYTKTMKMSALTTRKRLQWANMVGCVNSAAWKGWARGVAMFLGCSFSGSTDSSASVQVSFNFAIQPGEANTSIVPGIKISKEGHIYLWTMLNAERDSTTNAPKIDVETVWAAQVAPYADFSVFGL